jgi:hypothetical protein
MKGQGRMEKARGMLYRRIREHVLRTLILVEMSVDDNHMSCNHKCTLDSIYPFSDGMMENQLNTIVL